MIINYKEREKQKFKDIKCGDVFVNEEGYYCMKTNDMDSNIILLVDGELGYANDNEVFEVVDCELLIK